MEVYTILNRKRFDELYKEYHKWSPWLFEMHYETASCTHPALVPKLSQKCKEKAIEEHREFIRRCLEEGVIRRGIFLST